MNEVRDGMKEGMGIRGRSKDSLIRMLRFEMEETKEEEGGGDEEEGKRRLGANSYGDEEAGAFFLLLA